MVQSLQVSHEKDQKLGVERSGSMCLHMFACLMCCAVFVILFWGAV